MMPHIGSPTQRDKNAYVTLINKMACTENFDHIKPSDPKIVKSSTSVKVSNIDENTNMKK